jgi:hypothetical protein
MQQNIDLNGLSSTVTALVLNWGDPLPAAVPSHIDVVLAADCVYFEPAFPLLLDTLGTLIEEETVCYFCFKKRRKADLRFIRQARKVFRVEEVESDDDREVYSKEQIFLCKLKKKTR